MVRSVMGLDCMIAVAGYTSILLHLRRVAVANVLSFLSKLMQISFI